ncbi:hypothetical protein [Achromobacter phage hasilly_LB3]|nr:hypothetical protein [Achromobacter phage hasilly_LB3]WNO48737.1 hypothetical protein [Achromobacter phage nyaak_TL1]WNO48931.1 hypothetical protein [Achromobacter phage ewii_LB8]WNO48996.1 hypothetical protein [Achromobacter phage emuu_LB7]WNO49061.1 hypothetical protein [Achromobacter phage ehaak_LB5]
MNVGNFRCFQCLIIRVGEKRSASSYITLVSRTEA